MWSLGDYPQVGQRLLPAARHLVERAGVRPDQLVLDVGVGAGSVAVEAAARGARVLGVDLIDTWFDAARARAGDAGVAIDLAIADAEDLPSADGTFAVVLSNFAHIFAPRHDVVAREMARVCQPGGTLACTVWASDMYRDDYGAFAIIARYLEQTERTERTGLDGEQPAADGDVRNVDWGNVDYLTRRFGAHGVDMTVERHVLRWDFASEHAFGDFLLGASGPYIAAREALTERGVWDEAWEEIQTANRRLRRLPGRRRRGARRRRRGFRLRSGAPGAGATDPLHALARGGPPRA